MDDINNSKKTNLDLGFFQPPSSQAAPQHWARIQQALIATQQIQGTQDLEIKNNNNSKVSWKRQYTYL